MIAVTNGKRRIEKSRLMNRECEADECLSSALYLAWPEPLTPLIFAVASPRSVVTAAIMALRPAAMVLEAVQKISACPKFARMAQALPQAITTHRRAGANMGDTTT